jgi:hypothetical protein
MTVLWSMLDLEILKWLFCSSKRSLNTTLTCAIIEVQVIKEELKFMGLINLWVFAADVNLLDKNTKHKERHASCIGH